MVLKADRERVQTLLKDTITLLCKNGLTFESEFSVEALIGITLDKQDVFLININENIRSGTKRPAPDTANDEQSNVESDAEHSDAASATSDGGDLSPRRRKRKKRRNRPPKIKTEDDAEEGSFPTGVDIKRDEDEPEEEDDELIIIKEEVTDSWATGQYDAATASVSQDNSFQNYDMSASQDDSSFNWQGQGMDMGQFGDMSGMSSSHSATGISQGANSSAVQAADGTMQGQQEEGPFVCNICGNILKHKSTYKEHIKKHYGNYQHTCNICGKGFARKHRLIGHMSWHTGKRFQCELCSCSYRHEDHLKAHYMTKHGQK